MLRKIGDDEVRRQAIGIDMSLDKFDVAMRSQEGKLLVQKFAANKSGFNQFRCWLRKYGVRQAHLWIEATGRYWEALAEWSLTEGYLVTVLNPRSVRHFAKAKLKQNKTDRLDAQVILRFGECANPGEHRLWEPRSAAQKELRDLQLEVQGLNKAIGQERNRLKCGLVSKLVKDSIKATIGALQKQKDALQKESLRLIKQTPSLKATYDVLKSITGLGDITIPFLMAKIDFDAFSKGRQLVKFAGLDSIQFESGKSVKKRNRISRVGHADIRSALYWPAITSVRFDKATAEFANRIADRRCKMVAICAVMARLLRIAFAKVRDSRKAALQPV
jgi:transposase